MHYNRYNSLNQYYGSMDPYVSDDLKDGFVSRTCINKERYANEGGENGGRADNSSYNSYSQPTNINLPQGDNDRYNR